MSYAKPITTKTLEIISGLLILTLLALNLALAHLVQTRLSSGAKQLDAIEAKLDEALKEKTN